MSFMSTDIIKRLIDLASKLDEMGFHALADGIDESVGMRRTAALNPDRSSRMRRLEKEYEKEHRKLLLRALSLQEMLGGVDLPKDIIDRWTEILSDPENLEEIDRWLNTGKAKHIINKGDPDAVAEKMMRMPASWAVEDAIMPRLRSILGELVHHSTVDVDRRYKGGNSRRNGIEADFRDPETGKLFEMKEIGGNGPFEISKRAFPRPGMMNPEDFEFLIHRTGKIGGHDIGRDDPVDVSFHRMPSSDIERIGVLDPSRGRYQIPEGHGEILRTRLTPDMMDELISSQHGRRDEREPPWMNDMDEWRGWMD